MVGSNALVVPLDVRVEFCLLLFSPLYDQTGQASELVAGIFEHIVQDFAQHHGAFSCDITFVQFSLL